MGIQGLLPFLKKASRQASIKEFKGCTVAIDSYCWLHRGAFACAEKLALGEKTDQYVYYCMKYINNLLSFGIRPLMVFDGCRLPSKKEVERARRERRDVNRKKAAQLLREGKRSEARDCLSQCIDITPHMALELMNACREKGVDCIVAPYEADAQLAYLNKIGLAQVVITEDSDLLLFGCEKIMFKMDIAGNGILIEKKDLNNALQLPPEIFTFDKFRYICILSGCDYLSSLPGIGLVKASKLFRLSRQNDLRQVIRKIPTILRMPNLIVPEDYVDGFFRADNTFLFQLVFDPLQRKLLPLNPYPDDLDPKDLNYAGPYMTDEEALEIAFGNTNVNTGERIADFDPDVFKIKTSSWSQNATEKQTMSIWNTGLDPSEFRSKKTDPEVSVVERPSTKGLEVIVKGPVLKDTAHTATLKRARQLAEEEDDLTDRDLIKIYSDPDQSIEPSMMCSNDKNSFAAVNQSSSSNKRSRLSGLLLAADDKMNLNSDSLTKSNSETTTSNVLVEVLNIAADPTKCCSGDIERTVKESPVLGYNVLDKENSPEPYEKTLHCYSEDQAKQKNTYAVDGKTTKNGKFSLKSSNLDTSVDSSTDIEGEDISGQSNVKEKRRNIFAVDGKAQKEARFSLNASKLDTIEARSQEAEIKKDFSTLQAKSKRRNIFALDEDMVREPSVSASKHDITVESKSKDLSSPSQVPLRRRNVFAVDGKPPKESSFSLNSSKLDTSAVNVKSRFFTLSPPNCETKFFQQLKREHSSSNNLSSSPQENMSDEEQGNEEEDEDEEEEEEVIKEKSEKKPSEFFPSTGDHLSSSGLRSSDPHKNFKFSQFKSQFDSRKMTAPQATTKTNLPFKSVAVASGVSELMTCCSVSSQSSNGDPLQEDSDCLSEDPLDKSSSHLASSNEDRLATEEPNCLQASKRFSDRNLASGQRYSLNSERVLPDETEGPTGIKDSILLHRRRLSLDSETREMSESPTGKSSTTTRGLLSKGCRTSGLLKTKTKGRKSAAEDGCKQSAISQFFQTSFALNKKSVAKIAPSVKSPV